MYTSVTAVLLFVLSSFLTNEAVKLGDSYHDTPLQPKCVTCSKINIASVFGFISPILFTIDFFLYTRQYGFPCSKPNGRQVTVQHVQVTPMTENRGEQTDWSTRTIRDWYWAGKGGLKLMDHNGNGRGYLMKRKPMETNAGRHFLVNPVMNTSSSITDVCTKWLTSKSTENKKNLKIRRKN